MGLSDSPLISKVRLVSSWLHSSEPERVKFIQLTAGASHGIATGVRTSLETRHATHRLRHHLWHVTSASLVDSDPKVYPEATPSVRRFIMEYTILSESFEGTENGVWRT